MIFEESIKTCTVCGYEYDPSKGDPANGISPGTAWDEVDASWLCPDCQMPKSDFE
jgi:rubredoxin